MTGIHQAFIVAGLPDWSVSLETDQGGPWAPVTGTEDVVFVEGAPASGPDQTTTKLRAVIANNPGGATYSWVRRSGSTRITASDPTASETTFDIDAGGYISVSAVYDCEVTIGGTTRSATTDGQVVFDGSA